MSSRSSMNRTLARCSEDYGFDYCRIFSLTQARIMLGSIDIIHINDIIHIIWRFRGSYTSMLNRLLLQKSGVSCT